MKKLLLLLLIPILCACNKDDNQSLTIDAPALPTESLSWKMQKEDFNVTMQNAGYTFIYQNNWPPFYMNINDNSVFWGARFDEDNKLYELTYYYCGDNLQLARSFWAHVVNPEKKSFNWKEICSNPIYTSNATITLDEASQQSIEVGKISYESTLTAKYREKINK